jgi:hypothetical protein
VAFIEGLDLAEGASEATYTRTQLASLIRPDVEAGASANSILRALAGQGLGVRRSDGLALIRQVKSSIAASDAVQSLAMDSIPTTDMIDEWAGGRAGTYLYRVQLYVRDGGEGGLGFMSKFFDIQSDDLITPAEAQARAEDIWTSNEGQGKYPNRELWGTSTVRVIRQTGHS